MKSVFRILFQTPDTRPFVVLFSILLSSIAEAAGIGSLLPAITAIAGGDSQGSSPINAFVRSAAASIGVTPSLGNLIIIVSILMILKSILAFAAMAYAGVSAARVAISMRRRLITAIFDAKWSFYADQRGGRFANAVSNDAGRAGDAYLLSAQVVALSIQALIYCITAIIISWKVALVGILASTTITAAMGMLIRISKRAANRQTKRTSMLTVLMVDMLANIKPLKSMQRHQPMLAGISRTLKRLKSALVVRELAAAGVTQGGDATIAVLAGTGGYLAYTFWQVPLPEMIVSAIVFFQIISITSRVQRSLQKAVQIESAYDRTVELIGLAEGEREINQGKVPPAFGSACRFDHVYFSHGSTPVIAGATFDIPARNITVLSGPSGAGKTTIIDLLIGLNRAGRGRILIDSTPLDEVDLWAWRRMIGYVPQELNLFHASVRDNITLNDTSIGDEDILAAIEQAGAADFINKLPNGLDTDVGEMGSKFSGGQRQRISLARALVTKPQVLILDEVTSALDPKTEAEIVSNIMALRENYTIVAITHRPAWTQIADRLYNVAGGKVSLVKPRRKEAAKPPRKTKAKVQ